MRKNIQAVIQAFRDGKLHDEKTCRTDGTRIYSYAMEIAWRKPDGSIWVCPESCSPSNTTTAQIRAVCDAFGFPRSSGTTVTYSR